jgi:hypothetical protein
MYDAISNVLIVIIIQNANTKSSIGQHGTQTKAKVGSVAVDEQAPSADWSHPAWALSQKSVYEITHCQSQYGNYSLRKNKKQNIQHVGQW